MAADLRLTSRTTAFLSIRLVVLEEGSASGFLDALPERLARLRIAHDAVVIPSCINSRTPSR